MVEETAWTLGAMLVTVIGVRLIDAIAVGRKPRLPPGDRRHGMGQRIITEREEVNPGMATGAEIERDVCAYAREQYDFETYKFSSPGRRHVVDRIWVTPRGRVLWVEFKAPGERPRTGQDRERVRLRRRGQLAYTIDDRDNGKALADIVNECEVDL